MPTEILEDHVSDDRVDDSGCLVTTLPGGLINPETGAVEREVVIEEMDGKAEEIMVDPRYRGSPARMITAFLMHMVKRIGEEKPKIKDIINLLVGDRDYLMLKIRVHGMPDANVWPTEVKCPKCGDITPVTIDLNRLTVKSIPDDHPRVVTGKLSRGYTDSNSKTHKDFTIAFPTGNEQENIGRSKNVAVMKTTLMQKCIRKLGTLKVITDTDLRRMKYRERLELEEALYSNTPGVEWTVDMSCGCGNEWNATLDVSSLFRPGEIRRDSP